MKLPHSRLFKELAFSLIEVTIALGVVAFCLTSILGLFSVGIQSDRNSRENTALALSSGTVLSQLQAHGYSSIVNDLTPSVFCFDVKGNLQLDATGTPITVKNDSTQFICTVLKKNPTSTLVPLELLFTWPASAPESNQQKVQVLTSIAKYD